MAKYNLFQRYTVIFIAFYLISFIVFLLLILPIMNIKVVFWWLDNLLNLQVQLSLAALLLILINAIYIKKFIGLFAFLYISMIAYNLMPLYLPVTLPSIFNIKKESLKVINQKIISLNIAQLNLKYENSNLKELLPILGNGEFDLIALEEAADTEYLTLKKLDKYYPYSFGMSQLESTPSGMAIFSRWPIIEKRIHTLGYKSGQILEIIIQAPETNSPVQLFSLHPGSPRTKALWQSRNQTLTTTAKRINNSPFANQVIIGDFNNTPWTHSFKEFQKQTQLKNSANGFGYIPSWSYFTSPLLSIISSVYIDHTLVSNNFIVLDKRYHSIKGSDHLLILTKLAICIEINSANLQNAKKNKGKIEKTALSTNVIP